MEFKAIGIVEGLAALEYDEKAVPADGYIIINHMIDIVPGIVRHDLQIQLGTEFQGAAGMILDDYIKLISGSVNRRSGNSQ